MAARDWGREEWEVAAKKCIVSFWGHKKVLKLDHF